MEELKDLIHAIAGLPTLTIWILTGYLIYKLAVVGSMYGVIRYGIQKFVEWRTSPVTLQFKVGTKIIDEATAEQLQVQISRIASYSGYIHSSDVTKMRNALDAMEKKEFEKQKQDLEKKLKEMAVNS